MISISIQYVRARAALNSIWFLQIRPTRKAVLAQADNFLCHLRWILVLIIKIYRARYNCKSVFLNSLRWQLSKSFFLWGLSSKHLSYHLVIFCFKESSKVIILEFWEIIRFCSGFWAKSRLCRALFWNWRKLFEFARLFGGSEDLFESSKCSSQNFIQLVKLIIIFIKWDFRQNCPYYLSIGPYSCRRNLKINPKIVMTRGKIWSFPNQNFLSFRFKM